MLVAAGADPDHVASDSSKPVTHLTQIGVTPGPRHPGSILPLVKGKRNIELTSLSLSEEQVDTHYSLKLKFYVYLYQFFVGFFWGGGHLSPFMLLYYHQYFYTKLF